MGTACLVVVSLSHCLIAICFISFALCYVLINCYMFLIYSFYVFFLVLYVSLSMLCVLRFCIVLCIVSPHVYNYLFCICVQFYRPLPPGGNPTAVNKYHIMSYHTKFNENLSVAGMLLGGSTRASLRNTSIFP